MRDYLDILIVTHSYIRETLGDSNLIHRGIRSSLCDSTVLKVRSIKEHPDKDETLQIDCIKKRVRGHKGSVTGRVRKNEISSSR